MEILTLIISTISLLITFLMYKVAVKALHTWKEQKNYDLKLEAISSAPYIYSTIIKAVHPIYVGNLTEKQIDKHTKLKISDKPLAEAYLLKELYIKNFDEFMLSNKFMALALRVIHGLDIKENRKIVDFYSLFVEIVNNYHLIIDAAIHNYNILNPNDKEEYLSTQKKEIEKIHEKFHVNLKNGYIEPLLYLFMQIVKTEEAL